MEIETEIETEINKVIDAISNFKINMYSIEKLEGCIICYSYPGKEDWNKKNTLTTNFCEECNIVLCSDCYKKINGYKCPICHKQSHLINRQIQIQEIQKIQRHIQEIERTSNTGEITSYQRTPQENKRLRNQRYRQRKRERESLSVSSEENRNNTFRILNRTHQE